MHGGARPAKRADWVERWTCLDVGCGGGLHFPTITSTGRRILGIDVSFNQIRIASTRSSDLAQADAARLPFRDDTFATVTSTFTHTYACVDLGT